MLDGARRLRVSSGSLADPGLGSYAGDARVGDETWVYVAEQTDNHGTVDAPKIDVTVLRTSLNDGRQEQVTGFPSSLIRDEAQNSPPVAVAPDGSFVGYVDGDAVRLWDTITRTSTTVIEDSCPSTAPQTKGCFEYTGVLWGRSDALLVREAVWEGSHLVVVNTPATAPTITEHDEVGADHMNWSPDGTNFCAHSSVFLPDGIWVGDSTGSVRRLDLSSIDGEPWGSDCVWDCCGDLAFGYTAHAGSNGGVRHNRVSVYARHTTWDVALPDGDTSLDGWYPGADALIVSVVPVCSVAPCPKPVAMAQVVSHDGTRLPALPNGIGRVLGIVDTRQ